MGSGVGLEVSAAQSTGMGNPEPGTIGCGMEAYRGEPGPDRCPVITGPPAS